MSITNISASGVNAKNIGVQVLTQKDFDAMTPTRQAFIRDRIKDGQVKIVDPSVITPPTPPKPTQTKRGPNPVASQPHPRPRAEPPESAMPLFLNKLIRLFLTTGQNRTGILTNIYQYEVVIETKDGPVVILKHAIVSIELARFYQPPPTTPPTTTECTKLTDSIPEHD